MADPYRIRDACNDDLEGIRALVCAVLEEVGLPVDPEQTDADLADLDASYWRKGGRFEIVVDAAGSIAGSAGYVPMSAVTVELRKMYLRRDARGLGLGRRLLQNAIRSATAQGYRKMVLETNSILTAANGLYRRAGFVPAPFDPSHASKRADMAYQLDLSH